MARHSVMVLVSLAVMFAGICLLAQPQQASGFASSILYAACILCIGVGAASTVYNAIMVFVLPIMEVLNAREGRISESESEIV